MSRSEDGASRGRRPWASVVRLVDHIMSVCCTLVRLSDRNAAAFVEYPKLVYAFLGMPIERPPQPPGFLARLFGRASPPPPTPASLPPLPEPREEGDCCGLDKAWQAIHYILTDTIEPFDGPLGFIVSGGRPVEGTDVGYGPPSAFTSAQVPPIVSVLAKFDRGTFHARYKPKEMDEADVYPQIWERDGEEGFTYIWDSFESLRAFLAEAQRRGQGFLIYYS